MCPRQACGRESSSSRCWPSPTSSTSLPTPCCKLRCSARSSFSYRPVSTELCRALRECELEAQRCKTFSSRHTLAFRFAVLWQPEDSSRLIKATNGSHTRRESRAIPDRCLVQGGGR